MSTRRKSLAKPRSIAFANQQGRCFYCGQLMCNEALEQFAQNHRITTKQAKLLQCTGEHLTPHKDGGKPSTSNIVAACAFCNRNRHARKKELSPLEYRSLVAQRMSKGNWHPAKIAQHARNRKQSPLICNAKA